MFSWTCTWMRKHPSICVPWCTCGQALFSMKGDEEWLDGDVTYPCPSLLLPCCCVPVGRQKDRGQNEWASLEQRLRQAWVPELSAETPAQDWLTRLGWALIDRASQYNPDSCITVISALKSKNLIKLGSTPADASTATRCHSNSGISPVLSGPDTETLMSCTCSSWLLHPPLFSHLMTSLSCLFIPSELSSEIIRRLLLLCVTSMFGLRSEE